MRKKMNRFPSITYHEYQKCSQVHAFPRLPQILTTTTLNLNSLSPKLILYLRNPSTSLISLSSLFHPFFILFSFLYFPLLSLSLFILSSFSSLYFPLFLPLSSLSYPPPLIKPISTYNPSSSKKTKKALFYSSIPLRFPTNLYLPPPIPLYIQSPSPSFLPLFLLSLFFPTSPSSSLLRSGPRQKKNHIKPPTPSYLLR